MITYKGINFSTYENFYDYMLYLAGQNTAQNVTSQLANLALNIPLAPSVMPTCAYVEAKFLKSKGRIA
jgi:hypothetical protein